MSDTDTLPTAKINPERRISLAWIVPVLAVLAAGWLGYRAWLERGSVITISFEDVHGLRVGDPVRYRGANIGEVREIRLADDLTKLLVTARLGPGTEHLAIDGTQFWIVRPYVGFEGTAGLDTIVGPRYIAASLPSNSAPDPPRRTDFIGLPDAPLINPAHEDDLEIILQAESRGSLAPGAPVLYRQLRIGTIVSVTLAPDAGFVEARAHVDAQYVPLVREGSRFWDVGGYTARLSWSGFSIDIDSLQTFMTGGIAMATPPHDLRRDQPGPVAQPGHRFKVASEPQKAWLEWQPGILLSSE